VSPADFWAMLWGPGLHELRVGNPPAQIWIPCERRRPFIRLLTADDCYAAPVPRRGEDPMDYGRAHVLWARLERPDCAAQLARVPKPPTLVIREGRSSRRWAFWALSRAISGDWIARANARLSHHCKGRRGAGDPTTLVVSPFTRLTLGRSTPSRVYVEFESDTYTTAREIVGRLPDAPDLNAWKEAA
jgi:hypothetical protein